MQTWIIINLQVEGIHCRADCPLEEVRFLKDPHRHIFHIQCQKIVSHADRDIEIIMLKRNILNELNRKYWDANNCCQFGSMSCEMIAHELLEKFSLDYCQVLEDGENWGFVRI